MAIFIKILSSLLRLHLLMDFNINVGYDNISIKFDSQGARLKWLFLEKLSNSGCYYKKFVISPAPTFTNGFVRGDFYHL